MKLGGLSGVCGCAGMAVLRLPERREQALEVVLVHCVREPCALSGTQPADGSGGPVLLTGFDRAPFVRATKRRGHKRGSCLARCDESGATRAGPQRAREVAARRPSLFFRTKNSDRACNAAPIASAGDGQSSADRPDNAPGAPRVRPPFPPFSPFFRSNVLLALALFLLLFPVRCTRLLRPANRSKLPRANNLAATQLSSALRSFPHPLVSRPP